MSIVRGVHKERVNQDGYKHPQFIQSEGRSDATSFRNQHARRAVARQCRDGKLDADGMLEVLDMLGLSITPVGLKQVLGYMHSVRSGFVAPPLRGRAAR